MIFRRFFSGFLALTVLMAAGPAPAQNSAQPHITTQLSARSIVAGDQAVLAYQIIGGTQQNVEDYPQVIVIPDMEITFAGTSRRMVGNDGSRTIAIELRYMVQPSKAGSFTIPEQIFKVDGQDITAPAVTVQVKDGPAVAEELAPSAQLTIGKTEMWKGEVVPVQVAVLVHPSVQPAGQFVAQLKSTGAAVHRFDRSAGVEQRFINGEPWRSWQVESVMTPLQAGAQTFGPAQVEMDVFMPLAGGVPRDPFGSMGSPSTRKSLKLKSNTIDINVKELPAEGKPEGFAGAVGTFSLDITATPTTLKIGEPIAVEIAIDGTGNFDSVTPPPLETKEGWRTYEPRVAQENRGLGTEPGRRSWTQILIPEKNLTELPSFVLNYFDPVKGVYVTRKSPPVALIITGDSPASASGSGSEVKDFNSPSEALVPGEELNDILSKPLTGGRWITATASAAPASPLLLHGVPAAFLTLILGNGVVRRLRAAAAARRPAEDLPRPPADILASLRKTPMARRAFYSLVNEYLESRHFHTRQPLPETPEMQALQSARDRFLYGPATAETDSPLPAEERKTVLQVLNALSPVTTV